MMQKSEAQDQLLPAIIEARKKIDPILRDSIAVVKSDRGTYSWKYAGAHEFILMAVPPLLDNGIFLSFDPDIKPGRMATVREATATQGEVQEEVERKIGLTATIEHAASGQFRSASIDMPFMRAAPNMNVYQAISAAITYGSGILTRCLLGMASMEGDMEGIEGEGEKGRNGAPPAGRSRSGRRRRRARRTSNRRRSRRRLRRRPRPRRR